MAAFHAGSWRADTLARTRVRGAAGGTAGARRGAGAARRGCGCGAAGKTGGVVEVAVAVVGWGTKGLTV